MVHNMCMSKDAKDSWLTQSMDIEDTLTKTGIIATDASATMNKGLKARAELCKASKEIEMIDFLHVSLHTSDKLILPNCQLDYEMTMNPPNFYLMRPPTDATEYKFQLTAASLLVCRVYVSPSLRLAHASLLAKTNAVYPVHRIGPRMFMIPPRGSFIQYRRFIHRVCVHMCNSSHVTR